MRKMFEFFDDWVPRSMMWLVLTILGACYMVALTSIVIGVVWLVWVFPPVILFFFALAIWIWRITRPEPPTLFEPHDSPIKTRSYFASSDRVEDKFDANL